MTDTGEGGYSMCPVCRRFTHTPDCPMRGIMALAYGDARCEHLNTVDVTVMGDTRRQMRCLDCDLSWAE